MAKIDVKTIVTAPTQINIPLVRADYLGTANVFRVFFEIFLSISAAILGCILTLDQKATAIYWVFLIVTGVAAIAFAITSAVFSHKARENV